LLQEEAPRPSSIARRSVAGAELGRAQWADLDVLCLTAMQKDPQRRYHTVDALIRDVDHFLHNQPLDARPDSITYRAGKFVRRNRGQVTLAALATAALITLAGFYTVRLTAARDAALAEAARTQRVQRFMLNLFEGGDPSAGPADTLRVVTVVDRGLREARVLDREPVVQAELYATLGGIYQKLGNLARADSLLQTALQQRRAIVGTDSAEVAANLIALGMLRADQAQLEEAETMVRAGLGTARRHLPPMHPQIIEAITALGTVLIERGEYDSARVVLQQALQLEASEPDTLVRADILRQLANAHFYSGDYAASDSINQQLLAIHRKVYGPAHPLVAGDLLNLGASRQNRGEYAEAERYHRQALAITGNFYGTDHPEYAANLTMVGRALAFQDGKNDEVVAVLTRALRIQEQVHGASHPRVASALNDLGNVAVGQSDYATAERHFRRIRSIYLDTYGNNHQLVALATANLGGVFMNSGDNHRAEPLFREAVQRFSAALSPTHLDVGIARIKLGRVLMRQQRYAEGLRETSAGYEIVKKEAAPTVSFLRAARTDLAIMYDSLGQPERAAHFRAEQAAVEAAAKQ
jgi:serine/threonine-protein kinase